MSSRALRRLAKKQPNRSSDLATALDGLKELTTGLRAAIPEAGQQLAEAQEAMQEWRQTVADFHYQLARQRAVFLRMLLTGGVVPSGGADDVAGILELEAEYGAEYDAMRFLCWMAMLAGEDT